MPGPIFSMPNRFIWTDSPPKKKEARYTTTVTNHHLWIFVLCQTAFIWTEYAWENRNVTYCVQHATVVDILIYWVTVPRTHIKLPWTRIKVSTARSGTGTCLPRTLASAIPRTVALCCEPLARCPTARAARSSARCHVRRPPPRATVRVVLGPQPRGLSSSTSGTLPFAMVLRSQESKEPPDIKEVRTAWGGA